MTTGIHGYLSALVHRKSRGEKPKQISLWAPNLLTNNGRDLFHNQCYVNASAGTRGSNYIAVTESTITPAATDTTLTGEVTTNGLARADASAGSTHTTGTNSTTITKTFTATGAFTSVLASALFNAASGVTMTHIANFTTGSGTLATNDTLQVTWTLNLG